VIGSDQDPLTPLADVSRIDPSRLFAPKGVDSEPVRNARPRIAALAMAMGAAAFVLMARAADLAFFSSDTPVSEKKQIAEITNHRARILDRNGVLLAGNIETWDVYVRRADIDDPARLAKRLASVDGVVSEERLRQRLSGSTGRVRIARMTTPRQRQAIFDLAEPGIQFESRNSRYYPNGKLAAHALGWVDADGYGAEGLEKAFDTRLREQETPLLLSLDARVQFSVEDELRKAIDQHHPLAAIGIVTHIPTGQVLAMASWPDFDVNHYNTTTPDHRRNRAVTDPYELGSVFKPLTLAIALETGMDMETAKFNVARKLKIAGREIRDFHPGPSPMSPTDILVHSSNKGAAQMALATGGARQRQYLDRFGLLAPADIELRESARPYMASQNWSPIKTATIGYGHGLSVTALSFVEALGGVVNGGKKPALTLISGVENPASSQIVSEETSRQVRVALRKVVTDGTGRRADVPGFGVAGKTGSAEKWDPATSSYAKDRNVSSFVAIFPYEAPQYMVFVLLDEPQGGKSTYGWETAGWNAAPAVKAIITRIGPLLHAPYSRPGDTAASALSAQAEPVQ
jgi:cell division protein FtsI (penicillin-binding protein 3)